MGVEIKHHRLFSESILLMYFGSNLIQILINRLLNINLIALNFVHMIFYILKSYHSFFQFPIRPGTLYTICSSFLNDLINWQLWSAFSPFIRFVSILNGRNGSNSFQKSIEKQNHLLILMNIYTSIVIKYIKANCYHDINIRRFKH